MSRGQPSCIRLHDISCPPISPLHTSPDMVSLAGRADLCQIHLNITEIYNGPQSKLYTENTIQLISKLDQTRSRWHSELSNNLSLSNSQVVGKPPAVYVLHMTYLACLIVLHWPLADFEENRSYLPWSQLPNVRGRRDTDVSISQGKCPFAALEMSKVSKKIRRLLYSHISPIILARMSFIASTKLIFYILTAGKGYQEQLIEDRDCLGTCFKILDSMETHLPSSKYTMIVLLKIMHSNAILLDENVPEQTPKSINGHVETWMDFASFPMVPWPADLDWFLSASSSDDPLRGLTQDSGADGNDNSCSNLDIDQILPSVDFPGITSSTFSMQHNLPFEKFGGLLEVSSIRFPLPRDFVPASHVTDRKSSEINDAFSREQRKNSFLIYTMCIAS